MDDEMGDRERPKHRLAGNVRQKMADANKLEANGGTYRSSCGIMAAGGLKALWPGNF